MAQKKYSHKRMKRMMKEDEFASTMDKVLHWMKQHKQIVVVAAVAILAVVAVYVIADNYGKNKRDRSEQGLASALDILYYQPQKGETPKYDGDQKQYEAALKALEGVVSDNPTTSVEERATFYMAACYSKLGENTKALDTLAGLYAKADYPTKALVGLKYASLLEGKGDREKALGVLDALSQVEVAENPIKDYVLLKKGKLLKQMGQTDKAKVAFNTIVEQFQGSLYEKEAKDQLDQLGS